MRVITEKDFKDALKSYQLWKELDQRMRSSSSRGVNFHEGISEVLVCYVNSFYHSVGLGSEDAITKDNKLVQIKATSNFDDDLTSFGPRSKFDILHFARLDRQTDQLYLYDISIDFLENIKVNSTETFREQQEQRRRPRFSIIKKIIKPNNLEPYAVIDLKNGNITRK